MIFYFDSVTAQLFNWTNQDPVKLLSVSSFFNQFGFHMYLSAESQTRTRRLVFTCVRLC